MSRRPLLPAPGSTAKGLSRMAPGGRLWSESPIRPLWRPVGEAGAEEGPPAVLPTSFTYINRGFYGEALTEIPAFDPGGAEAGDMVIGFVLINSGPSPASITPPSGWQPLCNLSSGVGRLCVAGISAYAGTEGYDWGISGLSATDTSWNNYTWIFKGGSGLTLQASNYTISSGTYSAAWEQPDPSWKLRFQFVAETGIGGSFPMIPLPTGVMHGVAGYSTHFLYPAPMGGVTQATVLSRLTTEAPVSGSFTLDPIYGVSGYGVEIFSVAVGAS